MTATKASIPPALRWQVWERDNFTCHYCGARKHLAVDHVIAEADGGRTVPGNLVTACNPCNSSKGTQNYGEFLVKHGPSQRNTVGVTRLYDMRSRLVELREMSVHQPHDHSWETMYEKASIDLSLAIIDAIVQFMAAFPKAMSLRDAALMFTNATGTED